MSEAGLVVVRAIGLARRYGSVDAVRDLHLTVRRGEVYGFLGPNGAGKTTTLLMLLGIERPTAGTVELFGQPGPPDPFRDKPRIGVVGEAQYLYDDLSAWEYLQYFGQLYGVEQAEQRAQALLERLDLWEFRRLRARDYSRGMQQKLGLARALLHRPELLVLDEPVSGLDPHGIRQVREILVEERARGTTILLSSHILSEVERTADRVGILYGGRLVAEDTVERLSAQLEPAPILEVDAEGLSPDLLAALQAQPFVQSVEQPTPGQLRVRVVPEGDHRRAVAELVSAQGGLITGMRQERLSLEEAFVRLTQGNAAVPPSDDEPGDVGRDSPAGAAPDRQHDRVSAGPLTASGAETVAVSPPLVGQVESDERDNDPAEASAETEVVEARAVATPARRAGVWRARWRATWTIARRDLLGLLYGPGIYVVVALGMLATLPIVAGYLDAVERGRLLILADAFTLPFFVAATIGILFLALASVTTIAREREGGTLEVLFYGPVDHLSYVLGKGLAQLLAFLPIVFGMGALLLAYSGMTGLRLPSAFGLELLLAVSTAAAVAALGVYLSALVRGVRGGLALLGGLTLLFLAVRVATEVVSAIPITDNLSPLLLMRNIIVGVDWVVGYVSPFGLFQSGVDSLVRGDLSAYLGMIGLAWGYCGILLLAAVRQLARRGVRR